MRDGREHKLDLVCIGRTSVDLYAEQNGAKLEDVQSFCKYVGGSATNIAVGTARLGVKNAMLTRVGNEHMAATYAGPAGRRRRRGRRVRAARAFAGGREGPAKTLRPETRSLPVTTSGASLRRHC
jgi:hypothetical protein